MKCAEAPMLDRGEEALGGNLACIDGGTVYMSVVNISASSYHSKYHCM